MNRNKHILLDLYCGAGGAAMGYHRAGFELVGIDIKEQPRYPFRFVRNDALSILHQLSIGDEILPNITLSEISAIHASPPCQAHTRLRRWVESQYGDRGYKDYISETRQLLVKIGKPAVIENVPGAPISPDIRLNGLMFGLRVLRERWFETVNWNTGILNYPLPKKPKGWRTNRYHGVSGFRYGSKLIGVYGGGFILDDAKFAMGIDWMTSEEISEAIPPAYTEYIGKKLMDILESKDDPTP